MGGPNLEVFKFGLYLFVPVVALLHFGDPAWYHNHVLPVSPSVNYARIHHQTVTTSIKGIYSPHRIGHTA